jgi:N-acetylglucosamine kinase-like BadF-type ATPase
MHVLGLDAGGTKTVGYLANAQGLIVGEGRGGGANLHAHGELEVEKVLHAVVEQAIGNQDVTPVAACIGIAGVDRKDDDRTVRGIMRRLGFRARTLVVNDALIALVAGVGDDTGVVLIAGTGSIAYGVNEDGCAARAGGWGSVLGDEGSGYWIGREALVAVMRAADGRGPATRLSDLVLDRFGVSRVDALVREVYDPRTRREAVHALGPLVEQARSEGDVTAAEILAGASTELTHAAASVIARLGMRGHAFRIVLAGSMFRVIPWLTSDVIRRLAEVAPRATAGTLSVEPAMGAVHLALREAQGGARVPTYLGGAGPASS